MLPPLRDDGSETAAPHPEEMKATIDLVIGRCVSIKLTARATPAGLASAAVLISAIFAPIAISPGIDLVPETWSTRSSS